MVEKQAEYAMEERLDKGKYNVEGLVAIHIPLSNPYITNSGEYRRVDGQVRMNGTVYHFVKQAVQNGELVVLCIADQNLSRIEKSRTDYSSIANDFQQNNEQRKNGNSKAEMVKAGKVKYRLPEFGLPSSPAYGINIAFGCYGKLYHPTQYLSFIDHPPQGFQL